MRRPSERNLEERGYLRDGHVTKIYFNRKGKVTALTFDGNIVRGYNRYGGTYSLIEGRKGPGLEDYSLRVRLHVFICCQPNDREKVAKECLPMIKEVVQRWIAENGIVD